MKYLILACDRTFSLRSQRLGEAKRAWDAYDENLEKILGEDLTDSIEQAKAPGYAVYRHC